jgi:hypothetical protein
MMGMKISLAVLSTLTLAIALMAGCELVSPDKSGSDQPADISAFGGYSTSDEAPAFGDPELLATYSEDPPFEDDMESNAEVRAGQNNRDANKYALRIIWGNVENRDSTGMEVDDCAISDWSGAIRVDGGVAIIKRLIGFEPGDYVARPRRGPRDIEWVSYTKSHVDGLLLEVIDLPDPQSAEARNTIAITTPFYTGEIRLADLADYREFVVYDECNSISIVATSIEPSGCPRGFLEGRWVADTDSSGYFKGVWIGDFGDLIGYMRGVYGIREGRRVLFGKWISDSGEFQGLLRGTWSPLRSDRGPDGFFEGSWADDNLEVAGFFRGHYAICPNDTAGVFHGRWTEACR